VAEARHYTLTASAVTTGWTDVVPLGW